MVDHFSTYIYQKRGLFYFSRRVPKEVQQCHSKQRIVPALNTRSRAKALKYSQVICQRLDERRFVIKIIIIVYSGNWSPKVAPRSQCLRQFLYDSSGETNKE